MFTFPITMMSSDGSYGITNALWFDGSADYLTFTPGGAGSSRTVFTFSLWFKRSNVTDTMAMLVAGPDANNRNRINFEADETFQYEEVSGGASKAQVITNNLFRDPTGWAHLYVQRNGTNAVTVKLNGGDISTNYNNDPSTDAQWGHTVAHAIGRSSYGATEFFNGYLAEIMYIDGSAEAIGSFGEYDDNNVWLPVNPSGISSFGNNGFLLQFKQNGSGQNADGIGADTSGRGNHFAVGGGSIQTNRVTDTPSDDANNNIGNYWTLNSLQSNNTLTGGNLAFTGASNYSNYVTAPALPMTGKWYWEIKAVGSAAIGSSANWDTYVGVLRTDVAIPSGSQASNANLWVWGNMAKDGSGANGAKHNNSNVPFTPAVNFVDNSIMMIAVDMDNNKIWFGNDGTWAGSSSPNPATGSDAAFDSSDSSFGSHQVMPYQNLYADSATYNFGATAFAHTPPTGFKALNTANLPGPPAITKPIDYFGVLLWTGNQTVRTIKESESGVEGTSFTWTPDLIWIKSRVNPSSGHFHHLYDTVRGADAGAIYSNASNAQDAFEDGFDDFVAGGFTTVNSGNYFLNSSNNSATYVGWCWKAGGEPSADNSASAGATPTAGSVKIDGANRGDAHPGTIKTVRGSVSTTAGFSIIKYSGTGTDTTLGTGQTIPTGTNALAMFRNIQGNDWHVGADIDGTIYGMELNNPTGHPSVSNAVSDFHSDSGTTLTISATGGVISDDSKDYVAYIWKEIAGYSKIGTYTGNSTANNFVYTGFRPAYLMVKRLDGTGEWYIFDSTRDPHNVALGYLRADQDNAEGSDVTSAAVDFCSNGFNLKVGSGTFNSSGQSMMFLSYAEQVGVPGESQALAR